jgi:leucyl aminopeptidase
MSTRKNVYAVVSLQRSGEVILKTVYGGKYRVKTASKYSMKIKGENMQTLINKVKKLINLRYNEFNIDNYKSILRESFSCGEEHQDNSQSLPIKLMSGQHPNACILVSNSYKRNRQKRIFIVGKGLLFDSGGYNIKKEMNDMANDKAGMIIAIGIANYLQDRVVAYCPVTTNFLHNSQIIPGSILTIGNKKVEITNTDAEGRLVLAEALSNIDINSNDIVITLATLTGCVSAAVDKKATGVFGYNDELVEKYLNAAQDAKEYAWRLPLFDYMDKDYKKSPIPNYNKNISAGASEAAMFLKQFVKFSDNWIHLDIAYSAFDKNNKANGVPIKSLIKFIERIK